MKELPQRSLLPESFPQKAARFVLKKAIHTLPASVLLFAACSGGGAAEKNNNQELEDKESSGYTLPFPKGETWFLTNGPHGDGWSNGIKYGIDIAPPEGGFCPSDGRKFTIENRVVTASASGEVIIKGDDKNRNDPHHSEIRIKDRNGLTQAYIHLDNTKKVKVGNKVNQGDPLGNPSCEFPPGGGNSGPHVHIGLMKDGQPIPIDGVVVGGWTIHNGVDGKDGTMTKQGEKTRTANVGRFGENSLGIRNDLPNNSNKAVVASPKDPIPPISGQVTERKVEDPTPTPIPTAIPTPKPTETPKPTPTIELQVPGGWKRYTDGNYEIKYPSGWKNEGYGGTFLEPARYGTFSALFVVKGLYIGNGQFTFQDLEKPGSIRTTLAGQSAWLNDQRIPKENSPWNEAARDVSYVILKNGWVWTIGYASPSSTYNEKLPTFQHMLNSFKFLK